MSKSDFYALVQVATVIFCSPLLIEAQPDSQPESVGLAPGEPMADFGLRQLDFSTGKLNSMVWLSDFVGSNPSKPKKLVLLNFFAVWCKPCMAELPTLVRWQAEYAPKGFQILSINIRNRGESFKETLATTFNILKKSPPNFPLLFDRYTNRNQTLYMGAKATLPCNVLILREGKIVARFQGGDAKRLGDLEEIIKTTLRNQK